LPGALSPKRSTSGRRAQPTKNNAAHGGVSKSRGWRSLLESSKDERLMLGSLHGHNWLPTSGQAPWFPRGVIWLTPSGWWNTSIGLCKLYQSTMTPYTTGQFPRCRRHQRLPNWHQHHRPPKCRSRYCLPKCRRHHRPPNCRHHHRPPKSRRHQRLPNWHQHHRPPKCCSEAWLQGLCTHLVNRRRNNGPSID
jgi:hypothetical protein